MTNNEKIQKIIGYLGGKVTALGNELNQKDFCSAEWIYAKGYYEAMFSTLEIIEKIANEK